MAADQPLGYRAAETPPRAGPKVAQAHGHFDQTLEIADLAKDLAVGRHGATKMA